MLHLEKNIFWYQKNANFINFGFNLAILSSKLCQRLRSRKHINTGTIGESKLKASVESY